MHPTLLRQLKRVCDVSAGELPRDEIEALSAYLESSGAPAAFQKLVRGLPDFLSRVDSTYAQFERDLELRTRSLKLSSNELLGINDELRQTLESKEKAIKQLQGLAQRLQNTLPDNVAAGQDEPESLSRLIGQIASLIDQHEAHQAEMLALHTDLSNQKFALDQHAIVSICDLQGNITYANDRFCQISGYSLEELLGINHRIVKSDYHPPEFFRNLWLTISAGRVWRGEIKNRTKSGEHYWVSATIVPLTDAEGQPAQYIAIRTDITERKCVEQELESAKLAAEEASKAKSDFLANMSHEIRTPMNGIIGMTELALDTDLDATQHDYLNIVRTSAESLLVILNDILDFSKIEAGKLTIERIPFNLPVAIAEALKSIAARAEKKGLRLVCDLPADLPAQVMGDPGRIRQVLTNLCDNAIKFTAAGEVAVETRAEMVGPDRCRIGIAVSDTGIGIPADKQEQIFEAFNQADTSTTRKFGGTGLGLTICSRLVHLMGGTIRVDSEVDRGSRFLFTVELECPAAASADCATPPPLTTWPGVPALVVDDHPVNRRCMVHWLRAWGFTVDEAVHGMDALEKCRAGYAGRFPYRLVLLDANMPLLDGFGFARAMRQDGRVGDTQIIMLSSGGTKGDAQRCRDLGLGGYLTKPATPVELRETVTRLLAAPGATGGSASGTYFVTRHSLKEHQRHLSILLVEDNPINQQLALQMFSKWGHKVTLAQNGQEAVALFPRERWDIVFMDMQMAVMGGVEATRRIRAMEAPGQHTPIVAMTANAMVEDRQHCLDAGMDDYLSKPINVQAVHRLLDYYSARAGMVQPAGEISAAAIEAAIAAVDPEVMGAVGEVVVCQLPLDVAAASEAFGARDWETLRRAAHNMKSTFALFGLEALAESVRRVERDPSETTATVLDKLHDAVALIVQAIAGSTT